MRNHELTPLLVDIKETSRLTSIQRSTIYNLIQSGELDSVKVGRRRLIPVAAIHEFVQRKMEASH